MKNKITNKVAILLVVLMAIVGLSGMTMAKEVKNSVKDTKKDTDVKVAKNTDVKDKDTKKDTDVKDKDTKKDTDVKDKDTKKDTDVKDKDTKKDTDVKDKEDEHNIGNIAISEIKEGIDDINNKPNIGNIAISGNIAVSEIKEGIGDVKQGNPVDGKFDIRQGISNLEKLDLSKRFKEAIADIEKGIGGIWKNKKPSGG